ncbi:MAG: parallel beta-helix domain-containing protein [Pirellulales bacterium]
MKRSMLVTAIAAALLSTGCAPPRGGATPGTTAVTVTAEPAPKVTRIEPGEGAREKIQEALLDSEEGETIELAEGTFAIDQTLSLFDTAGVTIRGAGMDKTILDFKGMISGAGGEGLLVKADGFTLRDLTVQDTQSDAIKIEGGHGIQMIGVKALWTAGPSTKNGGYGLYPVQCHDVLIDGCEAVGASDAGIYVGQSENVIVRNSKAHENVAGIEIENTTAADVYDNESYGNTGGLLVFVLPDLPKKDGRQCRVFNNRIHDNNTENFGAEGSIVSTVPAGSGVILMASDEVEVFDNEIADNQTANLMLISYQSTGRPINDPNWDPYAEGIHIHDNRFSGGGNQPTGPLIDELAQVIGGTFPDILYDGLVDDAKRVDGDLPPEYAVVIHDNGDANFINFDMAATLAGGVPVVSYDLAPHQGEGAKLPAVVIEGVE